MPMAELKFDVLFQAGEPTLKAFAVKSGTIRIDLPGASTFTLPAKSSILGGHEFLLSKGSPRKKDRVFGAAISEDAVIQPLEHSSVEDFFQSFEFGFHSNIFFAEVLDKTNEAYVEQLRNIPESLKRYGSDAALFAQLNFEIKLFARRYGSRQLLETYNRYREKELYQRGLLQRQQNRYPTLELESIEMTRFVDKFHKDAIICREGELGKDLFVLLKGNLGVWKENKRIAEIVTPGEAFGEMALFLRRERTATIIAENEVAIYRIPLSELKEFHASHPKMFIQIARTLAERELILLEDFETLKELSRDRALADALAEEGRAQLKEMIVDIHRLSKELEMPELREHLLSARADLKGIM